jgi:hypothetical protein
MRSALLAAVAALVAAAPASAVAATAGERPMRLPAPGASAARSQTWIVGARPGARAAGLARRHGARALAAGSAYRIPAARARAFAAALRRAGALSYAEPDTGLKRASALDAAPFDWGRGAVVDPGLTPPPPGGVAIAVVDDRIDAANPDVGAQTGFLNADPPGVLGPHGTMVASAAAGAFNGAGVTGVFPGARLLSYALPPNITCADASDGIVAAARSGARVINLSFGSDADCFTLYASVQRAYRTGSLVVASSGNEFEAGNPVIFPAAYPHVLSVAALDRSLNAPTFSSENTAVDVAAPGVDIPVAVPAAFDTDGTPDGVTAASGTSFAAPMVAGAAAWLTTVRPSLTNGQVADVLRRSARDVGPRGYDRGTGFGLIRMSGALLYPTPAPDPGEPNDGITFVDGSAFGAPAPYRWRGTGRKRFSASVDLVEDPIDVYRIRVPRRAAFKVIVRPRLGDADVALYSRAANALADTDAIVARSRRRGRRTDVVRFVNRAGGARSFFVAVEASERSGTLNADYRIELARERRR